MLIKATVHFSVDGEFIEVLEYPKFTMKKLGEFKPIVKNKIEQIEMCFKAFNDENWQTQFD